ncbi:MAG: acyl-[acyl-carrier-protein]--UDP-N-acetylglucosamine O-acyltransferase [Spartobacteria bacterium]|nr:acyl-[acyl-carrier-protein]--UDP-N-acetylglucosamine O-acyltransferase [Spartobacteria bacterium]
MTNMIHPAAIVDPSAQLGKNVTIGAYAIVSENVVIGDDCRIDPHAVIYPYVTMGARCRVHASAIIGGEPQDLSFSHCVSYVRIGDDCTFREGVTIHRGTEEYSETVIGNHCYLMAHSHVAHNCILGNRVILANGVLLGGYVVMGDGIFAGGAAAIHQFVHIGRLAMLGGLGAISQDVPPFCTTVTGERNGLAGLNTVGLRRAGLSSADRLDIKRTFKQLFTQNESPKKVAEMLLESKPSALVAEMADFILQSKRGLCSVITNERNNN